DQSAGDENPATHGPALQQTVGGWAFNMLAGPLDEAGQTLNFVVTNDNHALFAVQPTIDGNGKLTYTPLANAHGMATVTVVLHDSGDGTNTSPEVTFHIEITKIHRLHNAAESGNRNGRDVTDGNLTGTPDGKIVAGDVIAVVNYINAKGSGPLPASALGPPYLDVDADNQVTANDVIIIVNYINAHPGQSEAPPEAEAEASFADAFSNPTSEAPSDLISLLAADLAEQALKRRRPST